MSVSTTSLQLKQRLGRFTRLTTESWARLRLSRLGITFDGRRVRGADGFVAENAEKRRDNQFGVTFQLNWQLRNSLTLLADYQLTLNDTNENFDFLNYTHNVASLTLQASY